MLGREPAYPIRLLCHGMTWDAGGYPLDTCLHHCVEYFQPEFLDHSAYGPSRLDTSLMWGAAYYWMPGAPLLSVIILSGSRHCQMSLQEGKTALCWETLVLQQQYFELLGFGTPVRPCGFWDQRLPGL